MAESYKVKIKYDNTEIKKGGQKEDLGRHKNTGKLVRVSIKKKKKPVDPELTCPSATAEARSALERKKMR